jgi:hypothetical protein
MKAEITTLNRPDFLGNGGCSSEQEILTSTVTQWWQKLSCCSIFAAVPAMLVSQVPGKRSDEVKKLDASIAGPAVTLLERLNNSCSNTSLLKRQSEFLLPHQKDSFNMLAALAGNDDCPGRIIPAGTFTATAPFIDSGDTTGANNTVTLTGWAGFYCYFYSYNVPGPDHVYSFTLTGRGPNAQIQVSRTSGTYEPLVYILDSRLGACTTGNDRCSLIAASGFSPGGTATIDSRQLSFLPLNVPLHLFVDSARTDDRRSGPYTIRIQDVSIATAPCPSANPIDCADVFVRQHYFDFLSRQPDDDGLAFWTNEIISCGGDANCAELKRINVSAAFFLSIEFQQSGYLVYKTYAAAFGATRVGGTVPLTLSEFLPDQQRVVQDVVVGITGWEARLEANQAAYFNEFIQRPAFVAAYPATMSNAQYVDALNANAGNVLSSSEREQLIAGLTSGAKTRAQALRAVAQDIDFTNAHFNRAFVLMQYFGYLRRNPNDAPDTDFSGYNFWLAKLDQFNGNFIQAEMVKAFLVSTEYRQRFGQP